ncbi:MAG: diaminopimelate epimerase, partial [Pelobium sp.]
HYIKFDTAVADKDVFEEGRAIRYNETYKNEGININFVEDKSDHLFVRTYERGVENETYACGTGVTAVALANAISKNLTGKIETPIKVLGGELTIRFDYNGEKFTNIFLEGPAKMVFEGEVEF